LLPSPSRLFSPRRHAAILRRDVELLSLDVFGLALRRMVLHPDDVHLLVATAVTDDGRFLADYPSMRVEAEERARAEIGPGVGIADIGDQLERLLTEVDPVDGAERARRAIRHELEIERLICRPDPDGVELVEEANQRDIPVAFVADSYLPRDLVARMLLAARYRPEDVLVSSHEGEVKASGLLERLIRRTGVAAERTVHVGPDPGGGFVQVADTTIRDHTVASGRASVEDRLVLGMTERTGLDSIGLALAADRLSAQPEQTLPGDLGYVAGGPLVCGFAAWVVRAIVDDDPDHVVLHGPTVGILHRVALALRPELAGTRLHRFDPADRLSAWSAAGASDPATAGPGADAPDPGCARPEPGLDDRLESFCRSIGVADGDRVLAIDLGWNRQDDTELVAAWDRLGERVEVSHLFLGCFDLPHEAESVRCWAFSPDHGHEVRDLAGQRIEILESLLGHEADDAERPRVGLDDTTRSELEAGVLRFADDFQPWMRLGRYRTTAAMVEPALRLVIDPEPDEARTMAKVASRERDGDGARLPLVELPVRPNGSGREPAGHRPAAAGVVWHQGFQALAEDDTRSPATRLPRRLTRRP
jgi:hypothetical protein